MRPLELLMRAKLKLLPNGLLVIELGAKAFDALKADIGACRVQAGVPCGMESFEERGGWMVYNGTTYVRAR